MTDVHDVAIETREGDFFQFLNVRAHDLLQALEKVLADGTALSLVNTDSCALVVPWRLIKRIIYVPAEAEEREDAWVTLWERASTEDALKAV